MRSPRTAGNAPLDQAVGLLVSNIPEGATVKIMRRKDGWQVMLESAAAGQAIGRGSSFAEAWKGPAAFAAVTLSVTPGE